MFLLCDRQATEGQLYRNIIKIKLQLKAKPGESTSQTSGLPYLKKLILENQTDVVFQALQKHIDSIGPDHKDCLAQKCFNYMDKRRKYLNYKGALDAELPIGSGEIESGVRSIMQDRLKIPGAWWLQESADAMLALKTVRANGFWEQYWNSAKTSHEACAFG